MDELISWINTLKAAVEQARPQLKDILDATRLLKGADHRAMCDLILRGVEKKLEEVNAAWADLDKSLDYYCQH